MSRPDLGSGYGGWQAVDATPQVCQIITQMNASGFVVEQSKNLYGFHSKTYTEPS